jgi:hypothetical protein
MTPSDIRRVVDEIEAYGRAEREATLTWARVVSFAGFSQVALWKKIAIKDAFRRAKEATKASATPIIKARAIPEQIQRLEIIIAQQREQIRSYDELWALYEYNIHRMGLRAQDLRRPLDRLNRSEVRSPHTKRLRKR